jgi:hypothetical protein
MKADNEHDPDLAAELRREWVEEAAEDESLTELLRMRRRALADVVRDMAHRRMGVRITFGGQSFNGPLTWVGEDYATVQAPGQFVDVRLEAATWEEVPGAAVERDVARVESFAAHLHELAASGSSVGVLLGDGGILTGRIEIVANDHVVVVDRDAREVFVPRHLLLGTIRPFDSH